MASHVELDTAALKSVTTPLNTEKRLSWDAGRFTRLRVESRVETNNHFPPHPISYDLVPVRMGNGHYFGEREKFTQHEFWVTKDRPGQIQPHRLDDYENAESLADSRFVIWHNAPMLHSARDEDFGLTGTNSGQGVAITTWAGFDLKPRNFFDKTPLYP